MSMLNPAAAAPMFMKRYQRLKPALRERLVVNRWQEDWKTVWMAAMNGAIRRNSPLASSPRWGRVGTSPTTTTPGAGPASPPWRAAAIS